MTTFIENLSFIGVEDGSFRAFQRQRKTQCLLCVVRMTGPKIDEIRASLVTVDGLDASNELSEILQNMVFDAIILGGITFAGFNIIDVQRIHDEFSRPILVFTRDRPNNVAMKNALMKHFDDWRERWRIVESLGPVYATYTRVEEPPVYFEVVGADPLWAEEVLRRSAILCRIPEPVRVARLVARGLSLIRG